MLRMMDNLTDRQKQIMEMAADGMYDEEIADKLSLAKWTVDTQISRIRKKFNLPSKLKAALIYQEEMLHEQRSRKLWGI